MKKYPGYILIVISFIFLYGLGGCKKSENIFRIKNDSEINIKGRNNLYLCADRYQNNQVIADRNNAGEWEKFVIHFLSDNKITLRSSDYSYVGVEQNGRELLYAGYSDTVNNAIFKITQIDSTGVVFQDYRNKYVSIDTNKTLRADKENIADASIFLLHELPQKNNSYFSFNQLIPLIIGLLLILISIITFQYKEDKKISIALLLLGGFSVRFFVSMLNAHLNLWDEQFHALVAKNMMSAPFSPMLFKNPVLPYDQLSWVGGYIWLHKQPLFLWQMALSMKIFGVNILAMRLPSMMMSTIIIYFIYRIGALCINKNAGFFGALFFALSNFVLEITAGAIHTDHNDVAFLFYVSAGIWAWVEYENSDSSRKKYFLILIGFFSGCAILVKWLSGLLVFSGWGISILLSKERRSQWLHYRNLLISLIVAVMTFLPWQIYILNAFPLLSKYEFALNRRHFFEVIEAHGGSFWWHFNIAKDIYGLSIYILILCIIILATSLKNRIFKTAFIAYIAIVYIFFGIAATKMIAFTLCISFLIYLAMGVTMDKFFNMVILNPKYLNKKIYNVIYLTLVLGILSGINLDFEKIQEKHTTWKKDENPFFYYRLRTTPAMKSLSEKISHIQDYVIFNCPQDDNVPIMFFNDVIAAYSLIPDYNTYADLKNKGYKMAVFDHGQLPSYLTTDNNVIKIPKYW